MGFELPYCKYGYKKTFNINLVEVQKYAISKIMIFNNNLWLMSVNRITQSTLACFLKNIPKIFLEYSWKNLEKIKKNSSYKFIKVYVKNLVKNDI